MVFNDLHLSSMSKARKNQQVMVRLTEEERANLESLADANGSTLAGTIRLAIKELLTKEENQKKLTRK